MKKLLMVCLLAGLELFGSSGDGWRVSQQLLLAKFEQQRKASMLGVEKAQMTITKAETLIQKARAAGNEGAELAAQRARETGMKTKTRYENSLYQINRNIDYVRHRLKEDRTLSERYETMLSQMRGKVEARLSGRERVLKPDELLSLHEGDELRTQEGAYARLECMDGAGNVQVGENSRVVVEEKNDTVEALSVQEGKIYTQLRKAEAFVEEMTDELRNEIKELELYLKHRLKKKMEVRTPAAVCAVRGTAFSVEVEAQGMMRVSMQEGEVEIYDRKGQRIGSIKSGETMYIAPDGSHVMRSDERTNRWWEE